MAIDYAARARPGTETFAEFLRANPHWGGVNVGETAAGLSEVLTEGFFQRLGNSGGFCVLYFVALVTTALRLQGVFH